MSTAHVHNNARSEKSGRVHKRQPNRPAGAAAVAAAVALIPVLLTYVGIDDTPLPAELRCHHLARRTCALLLRV